MVFGLKRKREEDEMDNDEFEKGEEKGRIEIKKNKIKDKEFKDLKSEHKNDRKEVVKPWGRKERLIVLAIFLFTTLVPAFLGLSSRNWKLPGLPRLTVPKVKLPEIGKNKIIMEENNEDIQKTKLAKEAFLSLTTELTGVYALSVVRLKNGSSYGINEDTRLTAASLVKLPVMAALYLESEESDFDLDQKYSLKNDDKVGGSGSLARKPQGYEVTFRNLLSLMGKQSDNTAYNIVRRTLGDDKIYNVAKRTGMVSTDLEENTTSASDISGFFESVWNGNLLSGKNKTEMLDNLRETVYESWLTAGLPENVKFSHKYGREVHVVNDAGIVMIDEPYVIVVLSSGVVDKEADEIIPKISKAIYDIETGK